MTYLSFIPVTAGVAGRLVFRPVYPQVVIPPAPTSDRGLGGDDVPRHRGWNKAEWKRRVKDPDQAIEDTLRSTYEALTNPDAALSVLSKVDVIVRPAARIAPDSLQLEINWRKIARDYERSNALVKLWQDEQALQREIEDEDETLMLWAVMQ